MNISYPSEIQDCRLLQLTADGDPTAFNELYDRHSTQVFSVALKILADHEEAKDVLQLVFLKLLKKASLYSPEKGRPAAWLARMTRNQSLDRLRQIKSNRILSEKLYLETTWPGETDQFPPVTASYADEVDLLRDAMAALRPEEIHVLQLAYYGGLTQAEIAFQLSEPLGSIKTRIRRALGKLRTSLEGSMNGAAGSTAPGPR